MGLGWGGVIPMAATHPRRRKGVSTAESATYTLGNTDTLLVSPSEFVEVLENAKLTIKQLVFKILSRSGPYTVYELTIRCRENGRTDATNAAVKTAVYELKKLGVIVRINGGYAIHNWQSIGA